MNGVGLKDSQGMDHSHKDPKFGKHHECFYCVQHRYFTKDSYKRQGEQSQGGKEKQWKKDLDKKVDSKIKMFLRPLRTTDFPNVARMHWFEALKEQY